MHESLLGWMHRLAKLTHEDLANQFDPAALKKLKIFVKRCLVDQEVPANLSANDFAIWIYELKTSEVDWSCALGSTILRAEELTANGDPNGATQLLENFSEQCSWIPMKEIAKGEALRHAGSK